uniref:Uncharacterized protein n=1 Tax=Electrophorus electricus TaxID=8005 RepID=A0AAY5EHM7_ELEEL
VADVGAGGLKSGLRILCLCGSPFLSPSLPPHFQSTMTRPPTRLIRDIWLEGHRFEKDLHDKNGSENKTKNEEQGRKN